MPICIGSTDSYRANAAIDELANAFHPAPKEALSAAVAEPPPRADAPSPGNAAGGGERRGQAGTERRAQAIADRRAQPGPDRRAQPSAGSKPERSRRAVLVAGSVLAAALAGGLLFWARIVPSAQSLDASLLGSWRGEGYQVPPGKSGGWSIVMNIREDGATIEYPSLKCGGTLTPISSGDAAAQYRETITHADGPQRCADGGHVTVRPMNGSLVYTWDALVDGARFNASAVLIHD